MIGVISPVELAVHDARRADRARTGLRQCGRVDAGPFDRRVRGRARRVRRRCRPAARHVQPRHRTGSGGRRRDRPQPRHVDGVAFIGSTRHRPDRRPPRRQARRRCWRWAATGRWWCSTTPTSTPPLRRTLTACFLCAGQSCTAGERILVQRAVHDEYVEKLGRAVRGADRARRSLGEATTMGPLNNEAVAAKMDEHVADALAQGAEGDHRRRARAASRPSSTGSDGARRRAADARVSAEETFGPVAPVVVDRLLRGGRRRSPTRLPTGCSRRSSPPICSAAWSTPTAFASAGSTSTSPATTGRRIFRSGAAQELRQRDRPGRRRAGHAYLHRAADDRDHPFTGTL